MFLELKSFVGLNNMLLSGFTGSSILLPRIECLLCKECNGHFQKGLVGGVDCYSL